MPTQEEILEMSRPTPIEAMGHSVAAIFRAVEACAHSQEEHDLIERNVVHLEIMLAKPEIDSDPADKTPFLSAITLGKEHLA